MDKLFFYIICVRSYKCTRNCPHMVWLTYLRDIDRIRLFEDYAYCLTQKDFLGKEERIFLINRTEHPRLAEKVRCLCVGCDATWGPPCQALVTRLSANRR